MDGEAQKIQKTNTWCSPQPATAAEYSKWLLCWPAMGGGVTHGYNYLYTCMNDYIFHVISLQSYLFSVDMGNCMSRDTSTDNAAKKREFDDLKSRSDTDNGHNSGGGTGGRQPKPLQPVSPPPTPAPPPSGRPCS